MKKSNKIKFLTIIITVSLTSGCGNVPQTNQSNDNTSNYEKNVDSNTEDDNVSSDIFEESNKIDTENNLSQKQKNSIAMLNYLMITAEEINVSKNNRLLLEDVYTNLINNTNPSKIDETTQDHINNLLDIIKNYRMISVKRERLQYIYNQDKASSLKEAVPDPLAVLSVSNSFNWKNLVTGIAYTAVDSYNNYKTHNDELDQQFFIDGWELNDKETENIQKNRERAFNYTIDIVREYNLSGDLSLNENAVKDFANLSAENNIHQKIQFLESSESTYKMLGNYWLELANCYYDIDEYQKCLNCINEYQKLTTGIFRKDYDYAQILPKAVVAAQEIYEDTEYITHVDRLANAIIENTENDDWSSRYFVAQVYLDLYAKTNNTNYLNKVYEIALNNVNHLIDEQIKLNKVYLSDVKEEKLDKIDDKFLSEEEKKELKKKQKQEQKNLDKYNKSLKKKRKNELPPLYEPLVLNCDLLFALEEQIDINSSEKEKIKGILQTESNGVFLSKPVNNRYSFTHKTEDYKIDYSKDEMVIPAELLTEGSNIVVTVENPKQKKTFNDWKVTKVKREGKKLNSFDAYISSKKIKSFKWTKNTKVTVDIYNGNNDAPISFKYKVKEYKEHFVIPDKIIFKEL